VLICGSRGWRLHEPIYEVLKTLPPEAVLVHGGARGADSVAGALAHQMGIEVEVYKADWARYGKRAGSVRNQQMLDEGKPGVVFAFYSGPEKSRGTLDMIGRAKKAGVQTNEFMKGVGWLGWSVDR